MIDDPLASCAAIVLAGGRGSRMARPGQIVDKPALTVGGRSMLDLALDAVASSRQTVVVGPERDSLHDNIVRVRETPAGGGPVAALAAGLGRIDAGTDTLVVLASDMPFVTADAVRALVDALSRTASTAAFGVDSSGRTQYLFGAWRVTELRAAVAALDTAHGAPMRALIPDDHVTLPLTGIDDCDTDADLRRARRRADASRASAPAEVSDALDCLRTRITALPTRIVPVASAHGTVLAEPLLTRSQLPAQNISAMDGYAVSGEGPWRLRSDIAFAGTAGLPELASGTAIRIATGAYVPPGATSVIRDERVHAGTDTLSLAPGVAITDDTRQAGEDWETGTELASAGTTMSAATVSAAISAEAESVVVRGPVRARVVLSGNEIRSTGPLLPGETRDALGPVLPHFLQHCGITTVDTVRLADTDTGFENQLSDAADVDLLVVVGATGGGAADRLRDALTAADAEILIGRMNVRPGGSQVTAVLPDGLVVLGLPGNPLAAVCTLLLTAPSIVDALTARVSGRKIQGVLDNPADVRSESPRLVPVRSRGTTWHAVTGFRTSHLAGLIDCDAVALVPPGVSELDPVTLLLLPGR